MITSTFLSIILVVITYIIGLLPDITATPTFTTAITTGSGYLSAISGVIPVIVYTLLTIISFDLLFEGGYLFYKIVYWVLRRLPTQS